MDKVIVTALFILAGVAAAVVVMSAFVFSTNSSSQAVLQSRQEAAIRTRTKIEVIAVAARPGGTKIDAWVKNVGTAPIADIDRSSLFLIQPGTRYDALTYNNDGVTSRTWYGDLKEAGLNWNQGDTLRIVATMSGGDLIDGPDDYVLRMSTSNGETIDGTFGSYVLVPTPTSPVPSYLWYLHSETSAIDSIDYYQLKDQTPADGTAATISSTISAATTGRIRPASNNGKAVFPLTGISSIGPNTWTNTYRVKRDKANNWWNTNWLNRRKISFDNSASTGNLDNFPVLVALTSSDIDFGEIEPLGADIRFIDDDDATELSYEIASWDDGALTATIWVKVPQIDALSTTDHIWLYYNNVGASSGSSDAAWESRYKGVWHLDEDTGAAAEDSTSNPNDGSPVGSPTASPGQIDRALTFTSTSRLDIAAHASLDLTTYGNWTLSAWVKPTSYAGLQWPVIYSYGSYRASLGLTVQQGTDGLIENWINNSILEQSDSAVTFNDWSYVAITSDGSVMRFYLNGNPVGTGAATTVTTAGQASHIGNIDATAGYQLIGQIDEVRVSAGSDAASARSAEWIAAQYKSMALTFQKPYGAEETNSVDLTVHADMDVLVRQSDGSIRSTLATNVANSADITDTNWTTLTSTYSFPGYTVVDDTDYLEIDLFADATANNSSDSVTVDFRIDDSSLGAPDQTRIRAP